MTRAKDGVFQVTDRNGCDGNGARFNIAPGYYNVYARAPGKPNKHVDIHANGMFNDSATGETIIPLGFVALPREKGQPKSVNINELFYVDVSLCTAYDELLGTCTETTTYTGTRVFGIEELLACWWDYNNYGLKNLQVRFYGCTLDPNGEANDYCR